MTRPPLGGRSMPLPMPENLKLKEDRLGTVNKQIEALRKVRAMISKTEETPKEEETQKEKEMERTREEETMPPPLSHSEAQGFV